MASTKPARGMRDFLPADVRKRNYVINIIKEVYESYGFEPLETPAVENIETLMGKYGEEGNQLVFKILKRGEKLDLEHATKESDLSDLALRYDLTVPLARVVANNKNELPKFFKRYQIQPVWRADRPARGRFREFYQCDVDAIGSMSMIVEAELISAVSEIMRRLGFKDFKIRINHREILRDLLLVSGIREHQQTDALVALDKLDKIGIEGVLNELETRGISKESSTKIVGFLSEVKRLTGNSAIYSRLKEFIGQDPSHANELHRLVELCENESVEVDPSLARGLAYYTGTIMEINVPDLAGSLGGGGRYDGLIGMLGKEQTRACGFSLGLERILVVMEERGMFPPEIAESTAADVLVTIWSEDAIPASLKLANELRSSGIRTTVYPEVDKLGKQIKYADSINVPYVCILGDDEIREGKVKLKNMKTGDETLLAASDVSASISK